MKTLRISIITLLAISLCFSACDEIGTQAGLNTDIDGDGVIDGTIPSNPSTPSIRPQKIDMTGVQGFAIVENTSNAPRTKADINGDGVDDDMPNGNGGEAVNTSPYALYTIDENGELHASIFYFEVVPSEDGSTDVSNTEVLKEISNALQIVPSLVTDLGKYILFSGCEYHIVDTEISDEALSICEIFIHQNYRPNMVYMIRKSDGALFDLSNQPIFSYYAFFNGSHYHFFPYYENHYDFISDSGVRWAHIPSYTYVTSTKDNLFVRGAEPVAVYSIEDNGDAVDVKKKTQDYGNSDFGLIQKFAVDENENIYAYNRGDGLHIYYTDGGFNFYKFEPSSSIRNLDLQVLDLLYDESGVPYIFLTSSYDRDIEEVMADGTINYIYEVGQYVLSARMNNGVVEPTNEMCFPTQEWRDHYNFDSTERHYYLGCYDNCFNWCLLYGHDDKVSGALSYYKILSYNIKTHTWTLREGTESFAGYDVIAYGKKTYGARLENNLIEITEIDFESETTSTYSLSVDTSYIVSPNYNVRMIQDVPYLTIDGRNTSNGAGVSITINLINGESNSTFASDTRNVVSFFRIN